LKNEKERKREKEKEKKRYSQKFVKKSVQQVFFKEKENRGKECYIKSSWKMTLVDYKI